MCFASCAVHKKQSKFSPFIRKYLVSITQEMKWRGGRGEAPCLPPPKNNVRVRERARVQMMFWLLLLLLLLLLLASTAGTSLDTSIHTLTHTCICLYLCIYRYRYRAQEQQEKQQQQWRNVDDDADDDVNCEEMRARVTPQYLLLSHQSPIPPTALFAFPRGKAKQIRCRYIFFRLLLFWAQLL